jgi:hypothetical protein
MCRRGAWRDVRERRTGRGRRPLRGLSPLPVPRVVDEEPGPMAVWSDRAGGVRRGRRRGELDAAVGVCPRRRRDRGARHPVPLPPASAARGRGARRGRAAPSGARARGARPNRRAVRRSRRPSRRRPRLPPRPGGWRSDGSTSRSPVAATRRRSRDRTGSSAAGSCSNAGRSRHPRPSRSSRSAGIGVCGSS